MESLLQINLAVINGYSYAEEIDEYLRVHSHDPARVQSVSGTRALTANARKVEVGRADATIENAWVMDLYLSKHNTGADLVSVGCRYPEIPIYIAFSPALTSKPRYRDIFDKGLRRFAANGRMAEIMKRYGVSNDH